MATYKSNMAYLRRHGVGKVITPEGKAWLRKNINEAKVQEAISMRVEAKLKIARAKKPKQFANKFNQATINGRYREMREAQLGLVTSLSEDGKVTTSTINRLTALESKIESLNTTNAELSKLSNAKVAGILKNTEEFKQYYTNAEDVSKIIEIAKKLKLPSFDKLVKAYDEFLVSHIGSDQMADAVLLMSEEVEEMFDRMDDVNYSDATEELMNDIYDTFEDMGIL